LIANLPTGMISFRFKQAENKEVKLGLAIPDFSRYKDLAQRISWLQPLAIYSYYWVQETGDVLVEETA